MNRTPELEKWKEYTRLKAALGWVEDEQEYFNCIAEILDMVGL